MTAIARPDDRLKVLHGTVAGSQYLPGYMWVTENVEIDDSLVAALREGELVIFAGAGVSMGAPTLLPAFAGLAEALGAEAKIDLHEGEELERYLGRVSDSGFPLHEQAAVRIKKAEESNRLHRALIDLAHVGKSMRLVTTNFDLHLSRCAREVYGVDGFEEYFAPALPLGDDFQGIVYLHGAVSRDPRTLVLTDKDFSRAYITRGWARHFLLDVFAKWPVMFVGFSHSDTILTYLARGLPTGTNRFALIQEEDQSRFQSLDITGLVFPTSVEGEKFQPLTDAIEGWTRLAGMGLVEHEERVRELTSSPPPQTQPDLDYARSVITDPDRVPFFRRYARSLEWLAWIVEEPEFRRLFEDGRREELSDQLAYWYAEKYVIDEVSAALGVLHQMGGRLSPRLWYAVAHRLWTGKASPEVRARWLPHLLANAPQDTADYLEYLLAASVTEDEITPLLLFDFLTDPFVESEPDIFADGLIASTRPSIKIRGDLYWLYESWHKVFQTRLDVFARALAEICTKQFTKAARLSDAFQLGGSGYEPSSMLRPSILSAEGDRGYRRWSDLLVDVGRESAYWILDHDAEAARRIVEVWLSSDASLLRRLGVHALSRATWLTSGEKLRLLLDRELLFERGIGAEVRGLIQERAGDAGGDAVAELLSAVDSGPPGVEEPLEANIARQRVLLALREAGVAGDEVNERLDRISTDHPELATEPATEVPDVAITEWAGPRSPRSVDQLLESDPNDGEFLEFLVSYNEHTWEESRDGLLEVLQVAARRDFGWSILLARNLTAQGLWDSDLLPQLIGAWSELSLSADEWRDLLEFLSDDPQKGSHGFQISDLLEKALRGSEGGLPYGLLDRAEELAQATWIATRDHEADDPNDDDWLGRAINRPAGKLILFLIRVLSERRSVDGIRGMSQPERSVFEQALTQETSQDRLGAVVLASQSHFLHSLDPEWARDVLLRVFDWDADADVAQRSWEGFLTWGRLSPPLIEDLMPRYLQATPHLARLDNLRYRFHEHLAHIALREQQPSGGRGWVDDFITRADPQDVAGFTRAVTFALRDLPEEFRQRVWDDWLREYWQRRLQGLPRPVGNAEAREIVGWAVVIGDRSTDAMSLAVTGPSGGAYDLFFHDLEKTELPTENPDLVGTLLLHVLREQGEPFYQCSNAQELLQNLTQSGAVDEPTQTAIREHLLRLHCG